MLFSAISTAPRMAKRQTLSLMTGRKIFFSKSMLPVRTLKPKTFPGTRPSSTASKITTSAAINKPIRTRTTMPRKEVAAYSLIAALTAQSFFGSGSDFYEYRFLVKEDIDPDDLATFYGSEAFMEIFCVFPFARELMMRGGHFDDDGTVHTFGFPGELLVSMAFTDGTDDMDGQWFNKRERFKDVFMGEKMWDQVSNFGFHTLEDGRLEAYHNGEYFVGRLPLISLGVKIFFQIHARWVAWATEHHLNHAAFKAETDEEEEVEELSRTNHMLYMIQYHFWKDFKAMVGFSDTPKDGEGHNEASFLSLNKQDLDENNKKKVLPIKHKATLQKIHDSLQEDKELDLSQTGLLDSLRKDNHNNNNAYDMARKVAMQRHQTLRVQRRETNMPVDTQQKSL